VTLQVFCAREPSSHDGRTLPLHALRNVKIRQSIAPHEPATRSNMGVPCNSWYAAGWRYASENWRFNLHLLR
jgi:hypothetical protein